MGACRYPIGKFARRRKRFTVPIQGNRVKE